MNKRKYMLLIDSNTQWFYYAAYYEIGQNPKLITLIENLEIPKEILSTEFVQNIFEREIDIKNVTVKDISNLCGYSLSEKDYLRLVNLINLYDKYQKYLSLAKYP